jgi:hypothetical protein
LVFAGLVRINTLYAGEYLMGAEHNIYERGMPRGIPTSPEKGIPNYCLLLVERHASLVAREEGVSFAKVWRLSDRECIELTAGQEAKGYWRLSGGRDRGQPHEPGRNTARNRAHRRVSRATVSGIERGDCRGGAAHAALVARRMMDMPTL